MAKFKNLPCYEAVVLAGVASSLVIWEYDSYHSKRFPIL